MSKNRLIVKGSNLSVLKGEVLAGLERKKIKKGGKFELKRRKFCYFFFFFFFFLINFFFFFFF